MSNYHLEVKTISRGKGESLARRTHYITGLSLRDCYSGQTYYRHRDDVLWCKVFLPLTAPSDFFGPQTLVDAVNRVERRKDARLARDFKGSLPNELELNELKHIVDEYIRQEFIVQGFCAVAAIHRGENLAHPERNNPHVHIIVPTRTVGPDGFSQHKDREQDKRSRIYEWRKAWEEVQNRAYQRNHLDIRVDCRSFREQGITERMPQNYINRLDWEREKHGERTPAGDMRRLIDIYNTEYRPREYRIRSR